MSCESPDVYQHWEPTARKRYRCGECYGWIEIGETYHRHRGLWDGRWLTHKQCPDCYHLMWKYNQLVDWDEQVPFGFLAEYLIEERGRPFLREFLNVKAERGADMSQCWVEIEKELLNDK